MKNIIRDKAVSSESQATPPKWTEKDGVFRFSVTSDGTTGEQWIARLETRGFCIGDYVKNLLRKDFNPTSGITFDLVVLKGRLDRDSYRANGHHHLEEPNEEVVCLIRNQFSDKELEAMGLYFIIEMDEIKNNCLIEDPDLLISDRVSDCSCLEFYYEDQPNNMFNDHNVGFAFVVS